MLPRYLEVLKKVREGQYVMELFYNLVFTFLVIRYLFAFIRFCSIWLTPALGQSIPPVLPSKTTAEQREKSKEYASIHIGP